MDEAPDFRSDKMGSLEGLWVARSRWTEFHDEVPDYVWADICDVEGESMPDEEVPYDALEGIAASVIERSELLGFWLAWHLAGGFSNLEHGGWHRATIHRKIRRFRARFGRHPDEFRLPWLRLDLPKAWRAELTERSRRVEPPADLF